MSSSPEGMTTNRPYLLRALYEWITDNGLTPHVLVDAELDGVDMGDELDFKSLGFTFDYILNDNASIRFSYHSNFIDDNDLDVMERVRRVFNPEGLCNPGKVLPDLSR